MLESCPRKSVLFGRGKGCEPLRLHGQNEQSYNYKLNTVQFFTLVLFWIQMKGFKVETL